LTGKSHMFVKESNHLIKYKGFFANFLPRYAELLGKH
jgi:hypothetical protein